MSLIGLSKNPNKFQREHRDEHHADGILRADETSSQHTHAVLT